MRTSLADNGGVHQICRLTDSDKNVTLRQVMMDVDERFAIHVRNYQPPGGKDVAVMDHPNTDSEVLSLGKPE